MRARQPDSTGFVERDGVRVPAQTGPHWCRSGSASSAHHWRRNYRDFLELFFSQVFTEPHSTKQREDAVRWGLETDADTLIATPNAPSLETREQVLELCSRVRCPVLVIHGDEDAITRTRAGSRLPRPWETVPAGAPANSMALHAVSAG
jgi:pimeloyl-ACP methyl ester carboxylesterase